jgi:hypothetical protein
LLDYELVQSTRPLVVVETPIPPKQAFDNTNQVLSLIAAGKKKIAEFVVMLKRSLLSKSCLGDLVRRLIKGNAFC